jgi:hypothetical protein
MPSGPKIIIVDTNCFARLYFSDLRPILGTQVCGSTLLTLEPLAKEMAESSNLANKYHWVTNDEIQAELLAASSWLKLKEPKKTQVENLVREYRVYGNAFLADYCRKHNRQPIRQLSRADGAALAAATVVRGGLATDEWPLRAYARALDPEDDGYKVPLYSTLELLSMLETEGRISGTDRFNLVRAWMLAGEGLPVGFQDEYLQLFGPPVPTGQSVAS